MKALLICYNLEKVNQTQRTDINRVLYGYKDFSNKGQYSYERKGILHNMSHIKPNRSTLIIKKTDETKIIDILKKYSSIFKKYEIQINKVEFAVS